MFAVTTQRLRVPLTPPQAVTHTSAVLWCPDPDPGGPLLVLGHGAGTDLTHPQLRAVARGLAEHGQPVLTFNFAYSEAGRKRPDPTRRLEDAYRDVLAAVSDHVGTARPLLLGGRSMGGRMASHLVAQGDPCAGLVLLSYPLTAAGRPEQLRTDHWPKIDVPVLFVSGDRDRLCDLDVLERERSLLGGPSALHVISGGDHSFSVRVSDRRAPGEVNAEVVGAVASWIEELETEAA